MCGQMVEKRGGSCCSKQKVVGDICTVTQCVAGLCVIATTSFAPHDFVIEQLFFFFNILFFIIILPVQPLPSL